MKVQSNNVFSVIKANKKTLSFFVVLFFFIVNLHRKRTNTNYMKKEFAIYFILFVVFMSGCSSDKHEDGLPCIDITKIYPEKELNLTDIANVTYLCLNSDNEDYLYNSYGISCVTKNTIVISDPHSGKILFFSKDGNPKSHFNHIGEGPEDYLWPTRVIYDEDKDEVFVYSFRSDVKVYTSTGEYKRKIVFPKEAIPNPITSFDDESFFLYDSSVEFIPGRKRETSEDTDYPTQFYNHPFVRISKIDGKVLDYVELPVNDIDLVFYTDDGNRIKILTPRMLNCEKGIHLCNPETDTVFLYDKSKNLTPVICKTPKVNTLDPMIVLNNCVDHGGYQFFQIAITLFTKETSPVYPIKYLMRDIKTGEVFHQKLILPDYKGKDFIIGPSGNYEEGSYFELELIELKQAYSENKLSGKLKELVANLNEEKDNNILMFVEFNKNR